MLMDPISYATMALQAMSEGLVREHTHTHTHSPHHTQHTTHHHTHTHLQDETDEGSKKNPQTDISGTNIKRFVVTVINT